MKHPFALAAPLVFLFLSACVDLVGVELSIPCPLPIPIVTDTTLTGTYNAACERWIFINDTLILVQPGARS